MTDLRKMEKTQKKMFILCLCALCLNIRAGVRPQMWAVDFETGSWQPHSLNDEPRFDTFGAAGATPYSGVGFSFSFLKDYALRFSIGYWALRDLNEVKTVHSLTLHPMCVDIKYWLLPDLQYSPYVMYGGGIYWGAENETSPLGDQLIKAHSGWGINLGAGVDFAIGRTFGAGVVFQYHLVRFPTGLGGVDDFSGPKITGMVQIFF